MFFTKNIEKNWIYVTPYAKISTKRIEYLNVNNKIRIKQS